MEKYRVRPYKRLESYLGGSSLMFEIIWPGDWRKGYEFEPISRVLDAIDEEKYAYAPNLVARIEMAHYALDHMPKRVAQRHKPA